MTSPPSQSTLPAIKTRQQLEAVVENIVQLQLERIELESAQDKEIAVVRQKYRVPLAEVERYLTVETAWAETWARDNPGALTEKRSLACAHATLGFRVTPPRVERASRKWTWSAIAQKLTEAAWGSRYLRTPSPEVNKEAILADRAKLPDADELRLAGLKIVEQERFFITAHGATETAEAETAWQEAA